MGVSLMLTGVSPAHRERLLALAVELEGNDDPQALDQLDALIQELEEEHAPWWPGRGDGKSWDVIHWALTGGHAPDASPDTVLFGYRNVQGYLAEAAAVLSPDEVAALADDLEAVPDATIAERLARVPSDLYWAATFGAPAERAAVTADAHELVIYIRGCADAGLGLLMTLN